MIINNNNEPLNGGKIESLITNINASFFFQLIYMKKNSSSKGKSPKKSVWAEMVDLPETSDHYKYDQALRNDSVTADD